MPTPYTNKVPVTTSFTNRVQGFVTNSFLFTNGGSYLLTNGTDRLIIASTNASQYTNRVTI